MKETPIIMSTDMVKAILEGRKTQTRRVIKEPERYDNIRDCDFCCPYGQVGDRLWVREKHCIECYKKDGIEDPCHYFDEVDFEVNCCSFPKWRPSIFMPKWAARIWLDVVDIWVERLQEITEDDAGAEGFNYWEYDSPNAYADCPCVNQFAIYWDSLNVKRGYPWGTNPWVFVISFKRVQAHYNKVS